MRQMYRRRVRLGLAWLALTIVLALAACGVTSGTGGDGTGGTGTPGTQSCGTPSSAPSTAVSTAVITPVGTTSINGASQGNTTPGIVPTVSPATSVAVTPGRLTVTTDASRYAPCVVIHATIANGFESNLYVTDHHTSCGLLTLERQVNGAWQAQGRCALMTPTRLLEIPTNTAVAQSITPGESGIRAESWPTGTYRLSLTYATGSSDHLVQQSPVYSAPFAIG